MEAHGNEYVQQLLDRAANLIDAAVNEQDTDQAELQQWLQEYHAEKARFGQPEGSPAYAETRGAAVEDSGDDTGGARGAAAKNRERRAPAPRARK